MQRFTIFLTFLLLLTACASPAQSTAAPTDISKPESDAPVLNGTFETSLLVTEWRGASEGNVLFPLDPTSGTALTGYTPISLGYSSNHAFSPDRQTLAVVSYPGQSSYKGSLFLINLPAWKAQDLGLELSGWVHAMVFSPDGKQLAIAHGESSFQLTMVDVELGKITAQSQTDSYVSRLKFTDSGDALMLYSPAIDTVNLLNPGPPQVLLLDASDLSPRWLVELEEVHDGIFPRDDNVTQANFYEPGNAFYISPGLVFALDRDALYVVHADSEQLTTVDFESQRVETVEIQAKLTWFERLLSMTAGVAHAKVGDGITRQAVISPDGQFLYVVGLNSATSQDQHGNWQVEQTPLGLEILQTSDGSRLKYIETDTIELSLSPDGRYLYLRNWGSNQDNIPWTEILDTANWQSVARRDKVSAMPVLLMNGEFLLASTYSTAETSHHMSVLAPDGSRALAEWTASSYIWWLTTP